MASNASSTSESLSDNKVNESKPDSKNINDEQEQHTIEKPEKQKLQKHLEPGMAWLKSEFIDYNYKPKVDDEYLSEKSAVHQEAGTQERKKQVCNLSEEPPKKKMKLKGRNKQRPVEKGPPPSERLCPALIRATDCSWGDKCKFSHDVNKYMSSKLPDLGETCIMFEKYGKCPYGIACRYGKKHISDEFTNIVDTGKWTEAQKCDLVTNVLLKPVQDKLWKRKYDFSKADKIFALVKEGKYSDLPLKSDVLENKEKKSSSPTKQVVGQKDKEVLSNLQSEERNQIKIDPVVTAVDTIDKNCLTTAQSKALESSIEVGEVPLSVPNSDMVNQAKTENKANAFHSGTVTDADVIKLRPQEKKIISFSDKLYLAPLTTVGNLPFRRICKTFGADITCGEMAMATNLLRGQQSEWALIKRHMSEDLFGVQLCGSFPDSMTRCAQLLTEQTDVDFIDVNCGCPIDLVFKRGEGCALMGRTQKFEQVVRGMTAVMGGIPLTVKMRTGIFEEKSTAHTLLPRLKDWGVSLVTIHGRSREQRYTRLADWDYINKCSQVAKPIPVFGNGDIMSYEDAKKHREQTGVSGLMLARGALIKPWLFTEIKEERNWDISSSERFDMLKEFVNFGLEHWGSDTQGVGTTRRFLLEWLSFLHRYIPVGILERVPQKINEKPPHYFGRDDLETLMASGYCGDWIKISEMLLGPVPEGFSFLPKHKANAYK